jgi:hypothetical protein
MKRFAFHIAIGIAVALSLSASAQAQAPKKKPAAAAKPAAPKPGKYGALAVDRSNGFAYGWSYDHPARSAAAEKALGECGERGGQCSLVVEFAGEGCAAYYTLSAEDGSAYGWGVAPLQADAESRARQECADFADGKVCGNHVWACNSKDVAPFKVLRNDPAKPKPAATDCLVQFEVNIETDGDDDWVGRVHSPVYRLSANDCAATAETEYHGFYYLIDDNGKVRSGESNPEKNQKPERVQRGLSWAEQNHRWVAGLQSPFAGTHLRSIGDVTVTRFSTEKLQSLSNDVGLADVHVNSSWSDGSRVSGLCLAYRLPGIVPVSVHGADRCSNWLK